MYYPKNYCAYMFPPSENRRQIAQVVQRLREQRRWSQKDLADASGVSQRMISDLENPEGPSPRLESLEAVAKAFQSTAEALFLAGSIEDGEFLKQIQAVIQALATQDHATRASVVEIVKKLSQPKP